MAWPKGMPRKPQAGKNVPKVEVLPEKSPVEIAPFDTCRYHRTEEPRIFKTGELIPEGWVDTPDKFKEK